MFIHVSHAIDVVLLSFRWPQNLTQEFWFSLIRHQCVGCHHRSPKWLWFYFAQNIQKHLNHRKSETLTLISHASRATPSHTAHVQDLQMGDSVSLQVDFLAISHKLHEQHRFHRSPTSFPVIMQASSFPRTRSFRDMRSTTSYLIVVGNNASSRASLHPDYQLPKDLWWAHSPGCPPPI